ncbi:MAG: hypothetical protein ACQES4_13065, partial [Bacillota bacterium]
ALPITIGADFGAVTGGLRGMQDPDVGFWEGAGRGALVGGVGGGLSMIGGAGMPFATNLLLGTAQGALTGGLDAALWGNDIGNGMLWGGAGGAVFTTLTSENFSNWTKGKGFYNNENVFNNFKTGKYRIPEGGTWQQEALDHFGYEGTYDPNAPLFQRYGAHPGITDPQTGDIFYHDYPFEGNFDRLALTADHEMVHSRNVLSGKYNGVQIDFEVAGKEEWSTYLHNYRNQGLYPNHGTPLVSRINHYGIQGGIYETVVSPSGSYSTQFNRKWWHFLYRIPRRW